MASSDPFDTLLLCSILRHSNWRCFAYMMLSCTLGNSHTSRGQKSTMYTMPMLQPIKESVTHPKASTSGNPARWAICYWYYTGLARYVVYTCTFNRNFVSILRWTADSLKQSIYSASSSFYPQEFANLSHSDVKQTLEHITPTFYIGIQNYLFWCMFNNRWQHNQGILVHPVMDGDVQAS